MIELTIALCMVLVAEAWWYDRLREINWRYYHA